MTETITEADLHPRPQLRRDRWFEQAEPFEREIMVPYPPESKLSGIHETGFHPVVWYRREVRIKEVDRRDRLVLHFGAVDYKASVWVNGRLAVEHTGGHTPFSDDITALLPPGD